MLELEDMVVKSSRLARIEGYSPPANAVAMAILYLEDAKPVLVWYQTLERVVEFIQEMCPQSVRLQTYFAEDCTPYTQALSEYATHTKH
ncbi:hypothetical protein ACN9MU_16575 [Pseudoduganella sp. R-32]|uniref:hypothetical protein n=1 Tax=Pseudoduganella sp. R-32 TaxID=3404061 RepID=UPI003CEDB384